LAVQVNSYRELKVWQLGMQLAKDVYLLTATIKDSWMLQFWILSQGAEITVLQPKELRARIRDSLRAALSSYGST